jgi:methyl-accepting chemotaxis protein
MARGDLTAQVQTGTEPIEVRGKDEFGRLGSNFNAMRTQVVEMVGSFQNAQASLCNLIGEVAQSAHSVSATSSQLAEISRQGDHSAAGIGNTFGDGANASVG